MAGTQSVDHDRRDDNMTDASKQKFIEMYGEDLAGKIELATPTLSDYPFWMREQVARRENSDIEAKISGYQSKTFVRPDLHPVS